MVVSVVRIDSTDEAGDELDGDGRVSGGLLDDLKNSQSNGS